MNDFVNSSTAFGVEKNCPVCGKKFYIYSAEWVYKIEYAQYVCSWHCMRKWEKDNGKDKKYAAPRVSRKRQQLNGYDELRGKLQRTENRKNTNNVHVSEEKEC